MIKEIIIRDYKNIKYLKLKDLRKVNVFVGKNYCGKSNILSYIKENYHKIDVDVIDDIERGLDWESQEYKIKSLLNKCEQSFISTHSLDILNFIAWSYGKKYWKEENEELYYNNDEIPEQFTVINLVKKEDGNYIIAKYSESKLYLAIYKQKLEIRH